MNQFEAKYARQRAEEIYKTKDAALQKKHRVVGNTLSNDQKIAALEANEFTINPDLSTYWYYRIVFNGETKSYFDQVAYDAEAKPLKAQYHAVLDEIILGDNEKAIALLREFASGS